MSLGSLLSIVPFFFYPLSVSHIILFYSVQLSDICISITFPFRVMPIHHLYLFSFCLVSSLSLGYFSSFPFSAWSLHLPFYPYSTIFYHLRPSPFYLSFLPRPLPPTAMAHSTSPLPCLPSSVPAWLRRFWRQSLGTQLPGLRPQCGHVGELRVLVQQDGRKCIQDRRGPPQQGL